MSRKTLEKQEATFKLDGAEMGKRDLGSNQGQLQVKEKQRKKKILKLKSRHFKLEIIINQLK